MSEVVPTAERVYVPAMSIRVDGGTQSRVSINQDRVNEYAALMEDGIEFDPITVVYDGKNRWLADGFHRLLAAMKAFGPDCTIEVETRQGTREDAVFLSTGANTRHGLPRTNADKRVAVRMVLQLILVDPERWGKWTSSRAIARHCGVSHTVVEQYRKDWEAENNTTPNQLATLPVPAAPLYRMGLDGKKRPAPLPAAPRTAPVTSPAYTAAGTPSKQYISPGGTVVVVVDPVAAQSEDYSQEFFDCKLVKDQLVITTEEDSVFLSLQQALALWEYLQENKEKLKLGVK